jgi:hypothetical protein
MGSEPSREAPASAQARPPHYSRIDSPASPVAETQPATSPDFASDLLPLRPFWGVWSVLVPDQICPAARAGHFTVVDEVRQIAYIGYGTSGTGGALTDFWALDLHHFQWRQIPLHGAQIPPRNGAQAIIWNDRLFLFGGFYENRYFADPYIIDQNSGAVTQVQTSGQAPSARSTPIMAVADDGKLFLWGGYNGEWPGAIHILDSTFEWTTVASSQKGRTSVPSVTFANRILAYGGSNRPGLWVLNMSTHVISILNTSGIGPPPDSMKAGMVRVGRHLFFVGGRVKGEPDWTLLYALDTKRMWWFVFFVMPDGESVTTRDGLVQNGCFLLPRIHSFGIAYSTSRRAITAFLGCPFTDPPRLFLVDIGDALATIHLRDDLRDMLTF